MADTTNDKILEAIRETLPETQVGLIKEALVERDSLKKENKALTRIIESSEADYKELNVDYDKLRKEKDNVDSENETLKSKIRELEFTNADLEKRDVRREADIFRAELKGVLDTQAMFLKNTIVREKIQHQVADEGTSVQTSYVNGQQVAVPSPYKNHRQVTDTTEQTTDVDPEEVALG